MIALTEVERRWLEYAWRIATCPVAHRQACVTAGGAEPGPGRVDGNELRWPGYLGRNYVPGRGVLCVAHVHREAETDHAPSQRVGQAEQLLSSQRDWLRRCRSEESNAAYLRDLRAAYEVALPAWSRWKQHFRRIVSELGLDLSQVAYTNLAKCRVPVKRDCGAVVRLCQREFAPISELIEAIRPSVVLTCVLPAAPERGREVVKTWSSGGWIESPGVV